MKKLLIILLITVFVPLLLRAQYRQKTWLDNFSYNQGLSVVEGSGKIYCSTPSGIIMTDTYYNSVSRISTVNGLSETNLKTIAWSDETSTLIIAYENTNIDLLKGNTIINVPEVMRKNISGLKQINRIRTRGAFAYIACSFGIVVLDLGKNEIRDTWKPGSETQANQVYDIAFTGSLIRAATASGIYEADISNQGLAFFGNWTRDESLPSPTAAYNCITVAGNNLFTNRVAEPGDSVFIHNGTWNFLYCNAGTGNLAFETLPGEDISIVSDTDVRILGSDGSLKSMTDHYGEIEARPSDAIKSGATLWIADRRQGLVAIRQPSGHDFYLPDGPAYNSVIHITADRGNIYVAGGAVDNAWNNTWKIMEVSFLKDNKWTSLPQSEIRDPIRIIPGKNNNYFVATWGMGLLEYSGETLINHYHQYNSPLISIIPGKDYSRICGLAFDKDGNLWMTQSEVQRNIKILRPDRTWIELPINIDAATIGDIIITSSGTKWIVLPRGHGLFLINDNNTPALFTDDTYRKLIVRDTDDKIISNIYSIAEDLDGNIWVGTDQGPAIYYNPDRALNEDIKAVRIKIPRNDGSGLADYMLGTEIITSVAIDGANRKWLGTHNSGAYLLSADGNNMLTHFTTENSPLPSNTIVSVAADQSNGLIWFGTASGIIAYRSDAPAGKEQFEKPYAFPNPVRPGYDGLLTITGLMRDSQVKIVDISGNLVCSTISTGSEATWNLMNYKGQRVSSGVYVALCSSPDGQMSAAVKILVISGNHQTNQEL